MSFLFRVIYATHCRNTHHKLALDALRYLRGGHEWSWRRLFLKHHALYLKGAKDPDLQFQDFGNHVLHVKQNYWGGAAKKAWLWYFRAVEAFQHHAWADGVYAAGVLSHYYTDPMHPFHTGQSEAANNIHRALEWSIARSYRSLWKEANRRGLPEVRVPERDDWLEAMVRAGAARAHHHYDTLVEHYDFDRGVKNPAKGLDHQCREIFADLIGYAVIGFSRVLERLFLATHVTPPTVGLTVKTVLSTCTGPFRWMANTRAAGDERRIIKAMYDEFQRTGRVEENLSEDERMVRQLIAKHSAQLEREAAERQRMERLALETHIRVLPRPRPPAPETFRFFLELESPLEEAPSLGPRVAERFKLLNVHTVGDFLNLQPEEAALMLNARPVTAAVIRAWQDQATLVCSVPNLRNQDAQMLVAVGVRNAATLAQVDRDRLLQAVTAFSATKDGQYVIGSGKQPDAKRIEDLVRWAQLARHLQAA